MDEIEEKVLAAIRAGKNDFTLISLFVKENKWRAVDRALQSLRRQGVIRYTGQRADAGWRLITALSEQQP